MKKYFHFIIRICIANFLIFTLGMIFMKSTLLPSRSPVNQESVIPTTGIPTPTTQKSSGTSPATKPISPPINLLTQVPNHNNINDCWIIVHGKVYDITTYFGSHPGGDGIMQKYCGSDASAAFDSKDKSPAVAHSTTAENLLQQYMIK